MPNDSSGGGVQRFIRYALQSDFETEGATFRYMGNSTNADDGIQQEVVSSQGVEQVNVLQNTPGLRTSTTNSNFEYQIGRVFELIFGTPAHATTTDDTVHTFDEDEIPPYLTVVVGTDHTTTRGAKHRGHVVDSATIGWELNGVVTVDVSTIGTFLEGVTVKPSHTPVVSPVLSYRDCTVTINSTDVKRVQSASVSITHAVEPVGGSEDASPTDHVFLGRTVEFTVNAGMNTNEFRAGIAADTINTVSFTVDNGVALGSGKRGFDLDLGQIVVSSLEEAGSVGGVTLFTLSGSAVVTGLTATDSISGASW